MIYPEFQQNGEIFLYNEDHVLVAAIKADEVSEEIRYLIIKGCYIAALDLIIRLRELRLFEVKHVAEDLKREIEA